jgi:N-acetylneuraminic acid mutarotase
VAVWTGNEMGVWGGRGDASGGRYDPVTDTWKPTSIANAPAMRWSASVVWTGTEMLVWGGDGGGVALNSGGRYDPASNTWTPMAPAPLAPRETTAAAWTGSQMVVWGGYNGYIGQMYADGARYNPGTNSWSPVASANAQRALLPHGCLDRQRGGRLGRPQLPRL